MAVRKRLSVILGAILLIWALEYRKRGWIMLVQIEDNSICGNGSPSQFTACSEAISSSSLLIQRDLSRSECRF